MDMDTTETKVQIRLTTRDPGLQISDEPSTLLVQTCESCRIMPWQAAQSRNSSRISACAVLTECAFSFNAP